MIARFDADFRLFQVKIAKEISDGSIGEGYLGDLTAAQAVQLKAIPAVDNAMPQFRDADIASEEVFPGDITLPWNVDYYGPLTLRKPVPSPHPVR